MILQILAAFVGTIAFAVLFSVPKKNYLEAGFIGAVGWILYYALVTVGFMNIASLFIATVIVVFFARYFAVLFQAPSTLFLIPGIFPLVPGGKIFWAVYHFMIGNTAEAFEGGIEAFKAAFVIVLGIIVMLQIPGGYFQKMSIRRKER